VRFDSGIGQVRLRLPMSTPSECVHSGVSPRVRASVFDSCAPRKPVSTSTVSPQAMWP